MKRTSRILPAGAAVVLFLCCVCIVAVCQEYGPDVMKIDNVTKATNRYLPVDFEHAYHHGDLGIACVTCHHTNDDDFTEGMPPLCSSCHNADTAISFKDALHKNCVVCHREMEAEGKNPPTDCLECHVQRP